MANSSTLSWHERGRLSHEHLEEEATLGRIAWPMASLGLRGVSSDALTAISSVGVNQEGILAVSEREDHRLVSVTLRCPPMPLGVWAKLRLSCGPRRLSRNGSQPRQCRPNGPRR